MAKKGSKKAVEEKKQPSKEVKETPKESEKKTELVNPYEEGTKSYLVAKALIAGEVNRGTVAREVGVSLNTIYNITADLTQHGYTLAIQQNKKKSGFSTSTSTTSTSTTSNLTHGEGSKEGSESGSESGSLPDQSGKKVESGSESDTQSEKSSTESERTYSEAEVQREIQRAVAAAQGEQGGKASSQSGSNVTPASLKSLIKETMTEMLKPPEVVPDKLPGVAVPGEDVEVIDEKINYRVKLNPEIFYRYSVFKARADQLGNEWKGNFSDYLDMATKDMLTVHGLYPTVLTVGKSGKIMVEVDPETLLEGQ